MSVTLPFGAWRINRWVDGSIPIVAVPVGAERLTEVLVTSKPVGSAPLAFWAVAGSVSTRSASDDHATGDVPGTPSSRHVG